MTNIEFDMQYRTDPSLLLCGVDEAGRGPLAGPVCAAAVILPPELEIKGLNDSKKLSAKKREALFPAICEQAIDYAVATASVEEIEQYNILQATFLAMQRAISGLKNAPEMILIDGDRLPPGLPCQAKSVIKGDSLSASIAAASVLAKVSRDRLMCEEMDRQYPQYGFAIHKGYGTAAHYEALSKYGPSPCHRMSFLKKWMEKEGRS